VGKVRGRYRGQILEGANAEIMLTMTNQSKDRAEASRRAVDAAAVSCDLRHRERVALIREAVLANIAKQRALREAKAQPREGT